MIPNMMATTGTAAQKYSPKISSATTETILLTIGLSPFEVPVARCYGVNFLLEAHQQKPQTASTNE